MKELRLFSFLFAFLCLGFSINKNPKHWGILVEEGLFLDKSPINFISYKEYLFYLKNYREDISGYWQNFPDSIQVVKRYASNEKYYVLHNPQFIDSSIVGLSFAKAEAYCRWRTEVVRQSDRKSKKQVRYSLPSPEDFKKAEARSRNLKERNSWTHLFNGPPELTSVEGFVWVKSQTGGKLVKASEVQAHEITFRCKAELVKWPCTF